MPFSRLLNVRQHFPDRSIKDIPGAIAGELAGSGFGSNLKPGARIAIGIGSRGIANIATIARSVVDFWKSRGCSPFIFPAMGSHGAATAEGQADVLAHYGIHERAMGCPVLSALEVVPLGSTPDGIEAFMDKNAYAADGVFLIGRVKWHTDFAGKIESGLFKMMAIGLGKFAGAQRYHTYAYRLGLEHVIRTDRPAGIEEREDSRRPRDSGRRESPHRAAYGGSCCRDGAQGRGTAGAGQVLDGPDSHAAEYFDSG